MLQFKVATSAAQVCGSSGARLVANQAAAIQVVRMGGDRFIFVSDQGGTELQGIYYDQYSGFQTINRNNQSMVVQMISKGQPNYNDALSAREILGPDWQEKAAKGIPLTCTN